ncbi:MULTISPECIES: helix-turn-helix domain-containing protein [Jiangella]|uniref:DNA-binding transcriptional regulator, XRE-family HTH domain n=1 Tax=Jiangella alba TaxID=561176 RepID=A0A1H5JWW4_9ACTN|nr:MULTISPECIES: helix-turn-helix transcriptional regulator [Jiangella]SDT33930.1 DNA-binding transcriptional regulator, XRE-family HTH domain [Jiangella sp. DSM 45060]SEE56910.1 DNA-binding transcriptional regulator, XRE-family HTH domain [Jiangella alba]
MSTTEEYARGLREAFGARLQELRDAAEPELSQEALAIAAGLDRSYVGMLERAERTPSIFVVHLLAGALGRSASDLLPDHPPPVLPTVPE